MFYVVVFVIGLMAGAGQEKTNEVINKTITKGGEITQSVKTKATELKDKIQK